MTEELWQHALSFLDRYGSEGVGEHREELYDFADQTGILERHRQLLERPGHSDEADMKIMYYELIKMLISHDTPGQTEGERGRQEMTARLQRYLNQRFLRDLQAIKRQTNINNNNNSNNNNNNSNNNNSKTKVVVDTEEPEVKSLLVRLNQLEENQRKLEKSNKELKETNRIMMAKFSSLARPASQPEQQVFGVSIYHSEIKISSSGFITTEAD